MELEVILTGIDARVNHRGDRLLKRWTDRLEVVQKKVSLQFAQYDRKLAIIKNKPAETRDPSESA